MNIYAKGKTIPTYPFANLLKQGERYADVINFIIGREYEGRDLSGCSFLMRGINSENCEAQQILTPEVSEGSIALGWSVSEDFTAVSGRLLLELRASELSEDGTETLVLKFDMSPITVEESPTGENAVLPDTSEQLLSQIAEAADEAVSSIEEAGSKFDIEAVSERLDDIEQATQVYLARPEVIPVTQGEYNTLAHKENALYVIVKE